MRPGEIGEVPESPAVRELEAPVVAICQLLHFTQTSWAGPPELVLSCPYPLQARPDKALATMYPEVASWWRGLLYVWFWFCMWL